MTDNQALSNGILLSASSQISLRIAVLSGIRNQDVTKKDDTLWLIIENALAIMSPTAREIVVTEIYVASQKANKSKIGG